MLTSRDNPWLAMIGISGGWLHGALAVLGGGFSQKTSIPHSQRLPHGDEKNWNEKKSPAEKKS